MKKCPSCGFEQSPENSRFCIRCGTPLSGEQPVTPGDAQPGQSTGPAAAPAQRASSAPGAAPSAPSVSRPSPYASLPHIPSSAKGGRTPAKKSRWPALLGGIALLAICICALFLLIQIGIGPGQSGGTPSPTSAPYTYRLGGDAYLSKGQEPSLYYINGSIYIDSTAQFSKANITVFLYEGSYRVASATETVDVYQNKIEYSLPVRLDSFYAQTSDRILVQINDIY